jgi:hypothetical protein
VIPPTLPDPAGAGEGIRTPDLPLTRRLLCLTELLRRTAGSLRSTRGCWHPNGVAAGHGSALRASSGMMRRHGRRQRQQRSTGRRSRDGRHGPIRDRRARGAVGGRVRGRLLGGAPRRPGRDPASPGRHRARDGRGHEGARCRGRAPDLRDHDRGRARLRPRGDRRRSGPRDRARDGGTRHRRPGRRQRRDGGPQGVPARQRPEPDQPQRAMHRDHREHDGRR